MEGNTTPLPDSNGYLSDEDLGEQVPTPEAWDQMKDTIIRLYIEEKRTLCIVREEMRMRYAFSASIAIYKKRLKSWGVSKNLNASEKQILVQTLVALQDAGEEAPQITLNGRLVPLHKIVRHSRAMARETSQDTGEVNSVTTTTMADTSLRRPGRQSMNGISVTVRLASPMLLYQNLAVKLLPYRLQFNIESLLAQFGMSMRRQLTTCNVPALDTVDLNQYRARSRRSSVHGQQPGCLCPVDIQLRGDLFCGLNFIILGKSAQGWKLIDSASAMTLALMKNSRWWHLVYLLLVDFLGDRWEWVPELRLSLLHYLSIMSRDVLPKTHPSRLLLELIADVETLRNIAEPALRLMLDVFVEHFPATSIDVWQLKRGLIKTQLRQKNYVSAASLCVEIITVSEQARGFFDDVTLEARLMLGYVYTAQVDYHKAISTYQAVLSSCRQHLAAGAVTSDWIVVTCLESLASIYALTGNHSQSELHLRMAIEDAKAHGEMYACQISNLFETMQQVYQLAGSMDKVRFWAAMDAFCCRLIHRQ